LSPEVFIAHAERQESCIKNQAFCNAFLRDFRCGASTPSRVKQHEKKGIQHMQSDKNQKVEIILNMDEIHVNPGFLSYEDIARLA
jgi:hypothetical protein